MMELAVHSVWVVQTLLLEPQRNCSCQLTTDLTAASGACSSCKCVAC